MPDDIETAAARPVQADGMLIDYDVPIAMDDGVVLRADVFRPADGAPAPVILSCGPYAKGLDFLDAFGFQWQKMVGDHPDVAAGSSNKYQNWEVADPEKWVPDGYVCVRVDSRGAGRSPGHLDVWSPRETKDLFDCIEWAAAQPWSTGKVGLNGISYYAINQWQVAGLQPPHLAGMVAWEGAADYYRDIGYHGGIYSQFVERWYPRQVVRVQYGLASRAPSNPNTGKSVAGDEQLSDQQRARNRSDAGADIRAHPLDDQWHRQRSADWSRVTVPFLSSGNWGGQGLHPRGNFEAFTQAASDNKWLEVHGDAHWSHFYTDYGRKLQKRFFDRFLKGLDNGWDEEPRVLLNVRHPQERFVLRKERQWPLARTQWTKLYLNAADLSLDRQLAAAPSEITYDGLGDGITFTLPVMQEQTELTGPLAAKLFISSQTQDADVFLIVRLFDPQGEEVTFQGALDPNTPIAQGWLRASHRKLDVARSVAHRPYHSHDEPQPLTPDEIYELNVEIWPTSIVVPPGYQLRLTVRGQDYEYQGELSDYARAFHASRGEAGSRSGCGPFTHADAGDRPSDVFGGKVTLVTGGRHDAHLLVPVIPA